MDKEMIFQQNQIKIITINKKYSILKMMSIDKKYLKK